MAHCSTPAATTLKPSLSAFALQNPAPLLLQSPVKFFTKPRTSKKTSTNARLRPNPFVLRCTKLSSQILESETESEKETEEQEESDSTEENEEGTLMVRNGQPASPVQRRRRRYRKLRPGEKRGITEEMRFMAMKLRINGNGKKIDGAEKEEIFSSLENNGEKENEEKWQPSMEGFLKYLVDSEMIFSTIERIVDESSDVLYVYFRKTGLERSDCISKDLEWFRQCGHLIPQTGTPGITYVQYLEELAEKSPPLFLCHFYNIYFSHIAGGQFIAKQVSGMLLEGRELEFYRWEGDAQDLLRGVRENLNALGEHWSRDEKNQCLREATKAFRFLGQIIRLIILIP